MVSSMGVSRIFGPNQCKSTSHDLFYNNHELGCGTAACVCVYIWSSAKWNDWVWSRRKRGQMHKPNNNSFRSNRIFPIRLFDSDSLTIVNGVHNNYIRLMWYIYAKRAEQYLWIRLIRMIFGVGNWNRYNDEWIHRRTKIFFICIDDLMRIN